MKSSFLLLIAVSVCTSLVLFGCNEPREATPNQWLKTISPKQEAGRPKLGEVIAGAAAIEFQLPDLGSIVHSIEKYRGKIILINFWATWCVPCVAEMPSLERLYQAYRDKGFVVLAISVDSLGSESVVRKFVEKNGLSFPILLDPEMKTVDPYGVTGFPETFFVDKNGAFLAILDPLTKERLVRIVSDRPWDSKAYMKLIEVLIKEPQLQLTEQVAEEATEGAAERQPKDPKEKEANS